MSRIPRPPREGDPASASTSAPAPVPAPTGWPSTLEREARRLARQLTPAQCHLIVRAGLPRWLQLATPWRPAPGREVAAARTLAARPFGLLEPLPHVRGAYQLTQLGELVAGIALLNVLTLS